MFLYIINNFTNYWLQYSENQDKIPVCPKIRFLKVAQSQQIRYTVYQTFQQRFSKNCGGWETVTMGTRQYTFREGAGGGSSGAPVRPGGPGQLLYATHTQYSQDWNSSLHTHGCAEVFFITGGHGRFRTQQGDIPVTIRDVVVVNANVPHTEVSQLESPLEYTVLGVEGLETLAGAEGYTMLHLYTGWEELLLCLRLMFQEAAEALPDHEAVCQNLLEVVLVRLGRQRDIVLSGEAAGPRSSRECDLVRRYIDNHFKENLTLNQLAEMAHINKYHLAHTFQKEFRTSPISYLIARRIQESRFLLRETDHSISQIAQILGFSSLSYFSQSFRRLEGISPMEYRRRHRKKEREAE